MTYRVNHDQRGFFVEKQVNSNTWIEVSGRVRHDEPETAIDSIMELTAEHPVSRSEIVVVAEQELQIGQRVGRPQGWDYKMGTVLEIKIFNGQEVARVLFDGEEHPYSVLTAQLKGF